MFEGIDAAGKGGAIRRVTGALDARQYVTVPIAAPTDEERAQPYLWRFWRQRAARAAASRSSIAPGTGACWSSASRGSARRRLDARLRRDQRVRGAADRRRRDRRQVLAADQQGGAAAGASRSARRRRSSASRSRPRTGATARNGTTTRSRSCDMVDRTSTELAPWTLVEANDKYFARDQGPEDDRQAPSIEARARSDEHVTATARRAGLPAAHAQTIYPALFGPAARSPFRRERVETPDGDFVDFDWLDVSGAAPGAPLVVLFHGLEGSSSSHYARALMRRICRRSAGAASCRISAAAAASPTACRAPITRATTPKSAGCCATVARAMPAAPLYAVGVSLGGSALLNWLGRERSARASTLRRAAAAVSAPLDLAAAGVARSARASTVSTRGISCATLKPKALAMARALPGLARRARHPRACARCTRSTTSSPRRCTASTAPTITGRARAASPGSRGIACRRWCSTRETIRSFRRARCAAAGEVEPRRHAGAAGARRPRGLRHVGRFPGRLDWLPSRLRTILRAQRRISHRSAAPRRASPTPSSVPLDFDPP